MEVIRLAGEMLRGVTATIAGLAAARETWGGHARHLVPVKILGHPFSGGRLVLAQKRRLQAINQSPSYLGIA